MLLDEGTGLVNNTEIFGTTDQLETTDIYHLLLRDMTILMKH